MADRIVNISGNSIDEARMKILCADSICQAFGIFMSETAGEMPVTGQTMNIALMGVGYLLQDAYRDLQNEVTIPKKGD